MTSEPRAPAPRRRRHLYVLAAVAGLIGAVAVFMARDLATELWHVRRLRGGTDAEALESAEILGALGSVRAIPALLERIDPAELQRRNLHLPAELYRRGWTPSPRVLCGCQLVELTGSAARFERALLDIATAGGRRAVRILVEHLGDEEPVRRMVTLLALGATADAAIGALPQIAGRARDPSPIVRAACVETLLAIDPEGRLAAPILARRLALDLPSGEDIPAFSDEDITAFVEGLGRCGEWARPATAAVAEMAARGGRSFERQYVGDPVALIARRALREMGPPPEGFVPLPVEASPSSEPLPIELRPIDRRVIELDAYHDALWFGSELEARLTLGRTTAMVLESLRSDLGRGGPTREAVMTLEELGPSTPPRTVEAVTAELASHLEIAESKSSVDVHAPLLEALHALGGVDRLPKELEALLRRTVESRHTMVRRVTIEALLELGGTASPLLETVRRVASNEPDAATRALARRFVRRVSTSGDGP